MADKPDDVQLLCYIPRVKKEAFKRKIDKHNANAKTRGENKISFSSVVRDIINAFLLGEFEIKERKESSEIRRRFSDLCKRQGVIPGEALEALMEEAVGRNVKFETED